MEDDDNANFAGDFGKSSKGSAKAVKELVQKALDEGISADNT